MKIPAIYFTPCGTEELHLLSSERHLRWFMVIIYLLLCIKVSFEASLINLYHFTAYPMGLPVWDTVRLTIEGIDGLEGTSAGKIFIFAFICKHRSLCNLIFILFSTIFFFIFLSIWYGWIHYRCWGILTPDSFIKHTWFNSMKY